VARTKHQKNLREEGFYEILRGNPHLWPKVILAAMPIGTHIIIEPHTNLKEVAWAMQKPTSKSWGFGNATGRLRNRQQELARHI
jgi:hypothetical protein